MSIRYRPIGTNHSPFRAAVGMPIQPGSAKATTGTVEVLPVYAVGREDLEGFSHLILLYYFHLIGERQLTVAPFLDEQRERNHCGS